MKPSTSQASAYQHLFDFFNWELFKGKLPQVYLHFTKKSRRVGGFFAPERWGKADDEALGHLVLHEISLNPDMLLEYPKYYTSILVHEMVHLWQHTYGKAGRRGYHNKEWAAFMNEIGLRPISYDNPGKETGQRVGHEIVSGGRFDLCFDKMSSDFLFPYKSNAALQEIVSPAKEDPNTNEDQIEVVGNVVVNISQIEKKRNLKSKAKFGYACPQCTNKIWGRDGLNIMCADCEVHYIVVG